MIGLFLISLAIPAAANDGNKIGGSYYPEATSESHHETASKMRPWPDTGAAHRPAFVSRDKPASSDEAQDTNNKAKQADESDLFYARRGTDAAETQAHYSILQFYVGVVSIVIGMIAAFATAWAAYEAAKAARAAAKATEIAEMSLTNVEAPFIFPVFDFPDIEYGPAKTRGVETARLRLKNFGKTPGTVSQLYYCHVRDYEVPEGPISFPVGPVSIYTDIIEAGGCGNPIPMGFLRRNWNGMRWSPSIGDPRFVIGLIRYSDVNGSQFICGFFYSMNPSNWSFTSIGGQKFNYRRKLTNQEIEAAESNLSAKIEIG